MTPGCEALSASYEHAISPRKYSYPTSCYSARVDAALWVRTRSRGEGYVSSRQGACLGWGKISIRWLMNGMWWAPMTNRETGEWRYEEVVRCGCEYHVGGCMVFNDIWALAVVPWTVMSNELTFLYTYTYILDLSNVPDGCLRYNRSEASPAFKFKNWGTGSREALGSHYSWSLVSNSFTSCSTVRSYGQMAKVLL